MAARAPVRTVLRDDRRAAVPDKEPNMPRYLVQRTFPDGLRFPTNETGQKAVAGIVAANLGQDVTWVHSYVSDDDRTTWCIYDAPSPEAIRSAAGANELPVDEIHRVSVLDPFFYAAP
jgi:hypothetical protein